MRVAAAPEKAGKKKGLLNPVFSLKDNTNGIPSAKHYGRPLAPWFHYINRDWLISPQESALEVTLAAVFSKTLFGLCHAQLARWAETKGLNIWIHLCSPNSECQHMHSMCRRLSFENLKIHIFSTDKQKVMVFRVSLIKIQGFSKAPGLKLKLL